MEREDGTQTRDSQLGKLHDTLTSTIKETAGVDSAVSNTVEFPGDWRRLPDVITYHLKRMTVPLLLFWTFARRVASC